MNPDTKCLILDVTTESYWDWNLKTDRAWLSPRYQELIGYSHEDTVFNRQFLQTIIHPDDRSRISEIIDAALQKKSDFASAEFRLIAKNDGIRWVEGRGKVVQCDEQGAPARMVGTITDISERKRLEGELRLAKAVAESRAEELEALMDAVPAAVCVAHDSGCRRISGSRLAQRLFGLPPIGASLRCALPRQQKRYSLRIDGREVADGQSPVQIAACGQDVRDREFEVVSEGGEVTSLYGNAVPLLDSYGKPRGAVGAFLDVTGIKATESKLRESEMRLRSLYEQTSDAIFITLPDPNGTIVEANPAACAMFGYSEQEIRRVGRAGLLDDTDAGFSRVEAERKRIGKVRAELYCRRKNGERFPVDLVSFVVSQTPPRSYVIIRDITFRKQMEDELRQAYRELDARVQQRTGELAATVVSLQEEIAERKRAEDALRESEARFENMFRNHDAIMLLVDPATHAIVDANRAAVNFYGYPKEVLLNMTMLQINVLAPDEVDSQLHALPSQKGKSLIFPHRIAGGAVRTVEVFISPIALSSSTLSYVVIHDITDRVTAERALLEKQRRLADMAVELSLSEDRERLRIASELHDNIGQDLGLAKIKLGSLANVSLARDRRVVLDTASQLIDGVIRKLRKLTPMLSPPILQSGGLGAGLKWLGRQIGQEYGLKVTLREELGGQALTKDIRSLLYRAVRELLINVAKHAGTGSARVTVRCDGGEIAVTVADRGAGFDPESFEERLVQNGGGFGLFDLRRRIVCLGGKFDLESAARAGTSVTIRLPLAR